MKNTAQTRRRDLLFFLQVLTILVALAAAAIAAQARGNDLNHSIDDPTPNLVIR